MLIILYFIINYMSKLKVVEIFSCWIYIILNDIGMFLVIIYVFKLLEISL